MSQPRPERPPTIDSADAPFARLYWADALFVLGVLALMFQVFPNVWWSLLSLLDVRDWTWRACATISAGAIVVLYVVRAWQANAWNNR